MTTSQVQWRFLTVGACVWAPFGKHGWRPAVVTGFGRNRDQKTVVKLAFGRTWRFAPWDDPKGHGKRLVAQLRWRSRERDDKPRPLEEESNETSI